MARTNWRHSRHHAYTDREAALRFFEEWRTVAAEGGDADLLIETTHGEIPFLAEGRDIARYRAQLAEMEALLEDHPIPFWQYTALNHHHCMAFFAADLPEAERLADTTLELGQTLRGEEPSGIHGLRMFMIRREQDRLAELAPMMRTILRLNPAGTMWRPGLTALLAEVGMLDEAREHLVELCADDVAAVPDDALWVACISFLADACQALGDAGRADLLYRLLRPYEGRNLMVAVFVTCLGSADRILGTLAATAGRVDDAVEHLDRSLADNRTMGMTLWEAHSAYELARVLLERRRPGDVERAFPLVEEAAALAARHDLTAVARRVQALRASAL